MFQLKDRALNKLCKYQLSSLLKAPSKKYMCLACLDFDRDSYGYSVNAILMSERMATYEVGTSEKPKQETVDIDLLHNDEWLITVHNSEHNFNYKGLYQFYFLDRKLIRWGRITWLSLSSRVKARLLLEKTDLYQIIVHIIAYQNEHSAKCVSPRTLVSYVHPVFRQLKQLGIEHRKEKVIEMKYSRLMDALVQSGDLSAGLGEIPVVPFDINPKIHLTHQELFTEKRRHQQMFWVAFATLFVAVVTLIVSLAKLT